VNKIRALIVDDHAVLRAGLHLLFNSQGDLEVVGEASDGAEAVAKVKDLKPDVVILDLAMVGQAGIPTIRQIRNCCPETRVLVLTMYGDQAYLRLAMDAGASGYVVKSAAHTELLRATREVVQGQTFVDGSFDSHVVSAATEAKPHKAREVGGSLNSLSPREREVFNFLVQGFTNPQIATQLDISVKSAETYRSRLMDKLQLRNRADVVRFALAHGLISSPHSGK
jgi:two-component system response regulator NreC